MFFFVQHRRNVATKLETPASPLGGERGPPFSASISSILALTLLTRSPHSTHTSRGRQLLLDADGARGVLVWTTVWTQNQEGP
jgi:hypothetical protein